MESSHDEPATAASVQPALHPRLIVVTGQGGSGKTTLAHRLAGAVGCPAICRDEIKEGMVHAHGPGFQAAVGDPLTRRAYPLFFGVLRLLLDGGVTVVAEAAFQHQLWERGLSSLSAAPHVRVVRCWTGHEEMLRRRHQRLAEMPTRVAHADRGTLITEGPQPWDAIHIDAPTLDVDTTDGYTPDLDQIAAFANTRTAG
ncbi:MAG: AAA family ATPase [Mycobacteriales bacterium]